MGFLYEDIFGHDFFDDCNEPLTRSQVYLPEFFPCENCKSRDKLFCSSQNRLTIQQREKEIRASPVHPKPVKVSNNSYHVSGDLLVMDTIIPVDGEEVLNRVILRPNIPTFINKPSHFFQVLSSLSGSYKPSILEFLSRFGTIRAIHVSSSQRGTAHAVGIWATYHHSAFEHPLDNSL